MRSENEISKSEVTAARIYESALTLFRGQGFNAVTMRGIAESAGVAVGASYYYYDSKDAIVMEFYRRSCDEMQEQIRRALDGLNAVEDGIRELIRVKLAYFEPNRGVLRALLRNGADPTSPLSPFSEATKEIRDIDIAWFGEVIRQSRERIPRDIAPLLPAVLWFFQMGIILFWVTDDSPRQARTAKLLPLACKVVAAMVRLSSLPLMRSVRKPVVELIEIVGGGKFD